MLWLCAFQWHLVASALLYSEQLHVASVKTTGSASIWICVRIALYLFFEMCFIQFGKYCQAWVWLWSTKALASKPVCLKVQISHVLLCLRSFSCTWLYYWIVLQYVARIVPISHISDNDHVFLKLHAMCLEDLWQHAREKIKIYCVCAYVDYHGESSR